MRLAPAVKSARLHMHALVDAVFVKDWSHANEPDRMRVADLVAS